MTAPERLTENLETLRTLLAQTAALRSQSGEALERTAESLAASEAHVARCKARIQEAGLSPDEIERHIRRWERSQFAPDPAARFDVVALVTSSGGLEASSAVLRALPPDFGATVIIGQHMGGGGSQLVEILSRRSALPVAWVRAGERLERGRVYVAPPRSRVEVHPDGTCALQEVTARQRPLDALLESLADSYGERAIGVVLTGMGDDGAGGVAALKRAGGTAIAQSEDTAEQPSMPRAAIRAGVDLVLPLHEIAAVIADVVAGAPLPRANEELDAIRATFGEQGEVAALAAEIDWSHHPLGPVHRWPSQLAELVRLVAGSPAPAMALWGEGRLVFVNEASLPTFGERWKHLFARPYAEALRKVPEASQLLSQVMAGQAMRLEKQLFTYQRNGTMVDAWVDVAYTPVRGPDGAVRGIHAAWFERTREVLAARRLSALNRLASAPPESGRRQALGRALAELGTAADLPFVAAYLLDDTGTRARLVGALGIEEGSTLAPRELRLAPGAAWPLHEAVESRQPIVLEDLESRFRGYAVGAEGLTPHCAALHPLRDEDRVVGALILGTHPRLPLDELYRAFLALAGETINAKMAEAHARQRENQRLERLADLDRAKTEFFSNVSHEFRTPLTLMLGPLEELQHRRAELPNHLAGEVDVAAGSARRLLTLVNTLLDFSLAEAGRLRPHFEPVDLAALTKEIAGVFRSAVERAGLELKVDAPPLSEPVWVDRSMWEKIVSNLLSNALKFTFAGSITVELRALPKHVELHVRDTGVGIPAAELPHIFKRFHRVRAARARTHEGAGIGLALVEELVRRHHGRVRALSKEGRGTTFTVWLPLGRRAAAQHSRRADPDVAPDVARSLANEAERWSREPALPEEVLDEAIGDPTSLVHAPGARLLVVDDNADMRDYLRRLLSRYWHVDTAADGAEALERIRGMRPDLVLADVMMPNVDGFGLLRALRADKALEATPVILVTARAGEETTIEGFVAGADDYVAKPFSARELVVRVAGQLALARARRTTEAILKARNAELRGQRAALEAALNGAPLEASLAPLVDMATESLGEGTRAAFYVPGGDGTSLHHVVGLSGDYAQAVDGFKIGVQSLACGLATATGEPVLTADVMTDPRWEPYRSMAQRLHYRGCWSFPILNTARKVVGTFAIYWREPREATQRDLDLAALLTHTAAIIISRHAESEARKRAEEALRETAGNGALYEVILDAAVAVMAADFATLHKLHGGPTGELQLMGHRGLPAEAAAAWELVRPSNATTCGAALTAGKRVLIADVTAGDFMAGTQELAAYHAAGIRAVQATPLISRTGAALGVLSTHWRQPHAPSERELQQLDILAQRAADLMERAQRHK